MNATSRSCTKVRPISAANRGLNREVAKSCLQSECKYYIDARIGIGLGRSFLGLLNDIYKGDRYFVGTSDSNPVRTLFATHKKDYELGLSPLNSRLETRLIGSFEKDLPEFQILALMSFSKRFEASARMILTRALIK